MYGDQTGEFVCGSWGLKGYKYLAQQEDLLVRDYWMGLPALNTRTLHNIKNIIQL